MPAAAALKTPTENQVEVVTDGKQLAWNMNATTFFLYYNSESEDYAPDFMTIKKIPERQPLIFHSGTQCAVSRVFIIRPKIAS